MTEYELVDIAFKELGKVLSSNDNATNLVARKLCKEYDIGPATAKLVVGKAFDRWVDVYYPD